MKIDIKVELFMNNEDADVVLTKEELEARYQKEIDDAVRDFTSGNCYESDMLEDFYVDTDVDPITLMKCIFNKEKAKSLVEDYRKYVTNYYQSFIDNYTIIEKTISVEI